MTNIIQANMNRSRLAHDLLPQLMLEHGANMALISEPYISKEGPGWFPDSIGTAAIWAPQVSVSAKGHGESFSWVKCKEVTYVSCYLTPNEPIEAFRGKMDQIEDFLLRTSGSLIVAGDFNAKAVEWGSEYTDTRGRRVVDMMARLGLLVLNDGKTTTFRRPGCRETIIDISMATEDLFPRVEDWRVLEDVVGSDHQYITFKVAESRNRRSKRAPKPPRWRVEKMDKEKFVNVIKEADTIPQDPEKGDPPQHLMKKEAEACVGTTMELIRRACIEAIPRKSTPSNHWKPAYWWTEEIETTRRDCLRARRKAQRVKRRGRDSTATTVAYKDARRKLRRAIRTSQARCWQELCSSVDGDPWGLGFKIVTGKLGKFSPNMSLDPVIMNNIVGALFPAHPGNWDSTTENILPVEEPSLFTKEELEEAVRTLKRRKCPGPDGIPSEVLAEVAKCAPTVLLNMYNACLRAGFFHPHWKRANLVLISKGKGQEGTPSAYRPLCMLDTTGKLLEKLIRKRLQSAIRKRGDLSEKQFGFREGRSTIDAIRQVMEYASAAKRGNHFSRPICILVTLDIKNAFNSMRWDYLMNALEEDFKVPKYLLMLIRSYLRDRVLLFETANGPKEKKITAGAAQGSILGPDLWNIFYDGILRMELPEKTHLVGYADDIALVVLERNEALAQLKLNQAMRRVIGWLRDHGLCLATAKTEIVVLTRRRTPVSLEMLVGDATIPVKRSIKYLGMIIDKKMTFWEQIRTAADKAATATGRLSRLMANIGGPGQMKRRLLMSVTHSIMLYGAEVWAEALKYEKYRKKLASVQRTGALRVACAYRTVSEAAILVIAGIVPIDLLVREKCKISAINGRNLEKRSARNSARVASIAQWQERWSSEKTGRWTARLIPDLSKWCGRKHGEVNFYLTQLLSGHGLFRAYLHKMGKVESPGCVHCGFEKEDAAHTFFSCLRWEEDRQKLQESFGEISPDSLVAKMLEERRYWEEVALFVKRILLQKKTDEEAM